MDSQTIIERGDNQCDAIRVEYICSDKCISRVIETDRHTLCYVISGSCNIDGDMACGDVMSNSVYILDKGSHNIEMYPSSTRCFEQLMIHIPEASSPVLCSCDVTRMDRAVVAAISENITLCELAARCCVSLSTFKRHFRARYSMSPHRWFHAQRMKLAYRLILDTNLSIAEVSVKCGYNTPTHFATVFRIHYGMTPLELRKTNR